MLYARDANIHSKIKLAFFIACFDYYHKTRSTFYVELTSNEMLLSYTKTVRPPDQISISKGLLDSKQSIQYSYAEEQTLLHRLISITQIGS